VVSLVSGVVASLCILLNITVQNTIKPEIKIEQKRLDRIEKIICGNFNARMHKGSLKSKRLKLSMKIALCSKV
jgi:hypothetical protein